MMNALIDVLSEILDSIVMLDAVTGICNWFTRERKD
jgi:hypothetical protein